MFCLETWQKTVQIGGGRLTEIKKEHEDLYACSLLIILPEKTETIRYLGC